MIGLKGTNRGTSFSWHRMLAMCKKEALQIIRDPSSILIAFVMPVILLVVFGYGINFDSDSLKIGVVLEDQSDEARSFASAFAASPYIDARLGQDRQEFEYLMQTGNLRGLVILPVDFSRRLVGGTAPVQVIADGSEPNTANFVHAYVTGVWQTWQNNTRLDRGESANELIRIVERSWFNAEVKSKNFIIPGAITIIITVVGAVLTSLVIAREWERGTMEALLATRITRAELLLSKLIPYYFLGLFALIVCFVMSIGIMKVPFRGSFIVLFLISSLFLLNTLGMGLLISTVTKNQFNAAQIALNAAFLPAIMLSGFVFEIDSMPAAVRITTYFIPARYYVSALHTLYLTGNVFFLLAINCAFLLATAILFIGLTAVKTPRRLE